MYQFLALLQINAVKIKVTERFNHIINLAFETLQRYRLLTTQYYWVICRTVAARACIKFSHDIFLPWENLDLNYTRHSILYISFQSSESWSQSMSELVLFSSRCQCCSPNILGFASEHVVWLHFPAPGN